MQANLALESCWAIDNSDKLGAYVEDNVQNVLIDFRG